MDDNAQHVWKRTRSRNRRSVDGWTPGLKVNLGVLRAAGRSVFRLAHAVVMTTGEYGKVQHAVIDWDRKTIAMVTGSGMGVGIVDSVANITCIWYAYGNDHVLMLVDDQLIILQNLDSRETKSTKQLWKPIKASFKHTEIKVDSDNVIVNMGDEMSEQTRPLRIPFYNHKQALEIRDAVLDHSRTLDEDKCPNDTDDDDRDSTNSAQLNDIDINKYLEV